MSDRDTSGVPERSSFLALVVLPPAVWAGHFLLSYVTAAVWCARFAGPSGSLAPVRLALGTYTVVALAAIALLGWGGYQRHSFGEGELPHDFDSPEDRHRFLGFATLLLASLSALAILFVAVSAASFETCS